MGGREALWTGALLCVFGIAEPMSLMARWDGAGARARAAWVADTSGWGLNTGIITTNASQAVSRCLS